MFRFFRKIRQRLLAENRLGNYLIYALGEIILVVIGILIALYLDDLQTQSRERDKELDYLHRFRDDVNLNLAELNRLIGTSEGLLGKIDSIFSVKFDEIPPLSTATFNRLNLEIVDYLAFQTAEATVEDLIGSGTLDVIESDSIREAIATWESGFIVIRALEQDHKKAFNELLEYLKVHADTYKMLRNEPWFDSREQAQILADRVYLNTLTYHAVPLQLLNAEYTRKQGELQRLIQIVEKEIQRIE